MTVGDDYFGTRKRRAVSWPDSALASRAVSRRLGDGGNDSCRLQQVDHRESAPKTIGGRPVRLLPEVRLAVALDQSDQHLRHDPAADRAEVFTVGGDSSLAQDVEPQ